jgi:hypothetical protein
MLIAVPFFGKDTRWLKLLEHWFDLHAKSGTKVPAVVITNDNALPGFPTLRVDTFDLHAAQRGHPWDRKGAIVAAASQFLGRFLVCDCDAFIQRDPEPAMATLGSWYLATQPDGWKREIEYIGHIVSVRQRQAGVMWFGDTRNRREILDLYLKAFEAVGRDFAEDDWREQLAWSLVAAWTGLHELPKTLNCSHTDPEAAQACIVHEHGETKWKRIA